MKTRILSGICMVIIAIVILSLGKLTLGISMALISLVAVYEGSKAIGVLDSDKYLFFVNIIYSLGVNSIYILSCMGLCPLKFEETMVVMTVLYVIICLIYAVLKYGETRFSLIAENIFFTFYVVVFFSYVALIRASRGGEALIWLVLLSPWATDTLAYFSGVFFGKHKLIEKVSPKKTIEGSIGGTIGCMVVAFIYGVIISKLGYFPKVANLLIFAAISSVISQFGDLAASCIKREHGVKDYGSLIPGHGGILDRFDSVLFVAPLMYYFMQYLPIL